VARGPNRRRVDRVPGDTRRRLARAVRLALPAIVAVATLAAVVLVAWRVGFASDLLRVMELRFTGQHRATATELAELSPVHKGDHLLFLDTAAVEAALRRHPWVAHADVRRTWPPALEVTVTEREPAALVDLGGLYLVDTRGEVFKRAAPGDGLDLPLVTGIEREDWIERRGEYEPLLVAALALLARWNDRGLGARTVVSELHVDPDYGTTLFTADGTEVRLGQGDIEEKLARLSRVLSALDADGQRAEVLHLDNRRRPDWVAVRLAVRGGGGDPSGRSASGR
jgi:cell division protein FtsQ